MNAPAAISGTFADFRTVKGRKVCQLIVEVPIEQANAALDALGGVPQPADPVWIALARLDVKAIQTPPPDRSSQRAEDGGSEGAGSVLPVRDPAPAPKRKWNELPPAQQAAIRCGEAQFLDFLNDAICGELGWTTGDTPADAAQIVRQICGVMSRTEINTNGVARNAWERLEDDYWAWQRDPRRSAA